jgi:peptidyl-prolyl cis-trans isomerase SurA
MIEAMTLAATRGMTPLPIVIALAGLALALAVLWAAPAMAQNEQGIAVLVNDEPISNYDVQQRVRLITVTTRQKNSERLRNQAIDALIEEKLMMQEAKRLNVEIPQDTVQQELERIAKSSKMNTKQLAAALREVGINIDAFTKRIEAQVAWSLVIRNRFAQSVTVRPEDVESAFQSQDGPKITSRYEYVLQGILFIVPNGASDATLSARRNMAERFRGGFRSCTESRSQIAGLPDVVITDIGKRTSNTMAPSDQERFGKLSVNQTTAPQKGEQGFELIAVCAKTEIKDEEQARRTAERNLLTQELEVRSRRHLHDLKQDAVIERRQ